MTTNKEEPAPKCRTHPGSGFVEGECLACRLGWPPEEPAPDGAVRKLSDYDMWHLPCGRCGFDPGKGESTACWKCGYRLQRDFTDRALKRTTPPAAAGDGQYTCSKCSTRTSAISPLGQPGVIICEDCASPRRRGLEMHTHLQQAGETPRTELLVNLIDNLRREGGVHLNNPAFADLYDALLEYNGYVCGQLAKMAARIAALEAEARGLHQLRRDYEVKVTKDAHRIAQLEQDAAGLRSQLEDEKRKAGAWKNRYVDIKNTFEDSGNCWVWQSDGDNNLETITCSILIRPDQMREFQAEARGLREHLGHIHEILSEKEAAGEDLELGSTAFKSALRWSKSFPPSPGVGD